MFRETVNFRNNQRGLCPYPSSAVNVLKNRTSTAFSAFFDVDVPEKRTSAALRHPASLEEGLEKRQSIAIFAWINRIFEMKKYIIESLVSGAIYCIGLLALDARPGHQFKAAGFYLISSVIFGLLFSLVMRLIQKRIGKKSDKK